SWTTDSRRWDAFRPRTGDIVVSTPAKCGTTWMIQIANLLVEQSPAPLPIWLLSPWLDVRDYALEQAIAALEAQTRRRVIKSHLPSDALPLYDGVRYIHVARHGLDAFMSWHNHVRHYTAAVWAHLDATGLADETIARPHPRVPDSIHDFYRAWMTEGPDAGPTSCWSTTTTSNPISTARCAASRPSWALRSTRPSGRRSSRRRVSRRCGKAVPSSCSAAVRPGRTGTKPSSTPEATAAGAMC